MPRTWVRSPVAITEPTWLRAQVDRLASSSAIRMYTSSSGMREGASLPACAAPRRCGRMPRRCATRESYGVARAGVRYRTYVLILLMESHTSGTAWAQALHRLSKACTPLFPQMLGLAVEDAQRVVPGS